MNKKTKVCICCGKNLELNTKKIFVKNVLKIYQLKKKIIITKLIQNIFLIFLFVKNVKNK